MGRDAGVTTTPNRAQGLLIDSTVSATSIGSINDNIAGNGTDINRGADINILGGSLNVTGTAAGDFVIGNNAGACNEFLTMSSGSLSYAGADGLQTTTVAVTGAVLTTDEETGIFISGGTATLSGITLNAISSTVATSTLNVSGGTLYLGNVGLVANAPAGSKITTLFGTATVAATANWSTGAPITLRSISL